MHFYGEFDEKNDGITFIWIKISVPFQKCFLKNAIFTPTPKLLDNWQTLQNSQDQDFSYIVIFSSLKNATRPADLEKYKGLWPSMNYNEAKFKSNQSKTRNL